MTRYFWILSLLLAMTAISSAAYGFSMGGEISSSYEILRESDKESESLWENSFRLDNTEIIAPYLELNFYGKYIQDDEENFTDLYAAYLQYSSFQQAVELKLGRFDYVGNRFLTIDGAEFTMRTDFYLGATIFAGLPKYFDTDDRHINETFRDTGDRLYGGKIFLNGVKNTTGYLSMSKEEKDEVSLQELLGAGLGRQFTLGEFRLDAGVKLEFDTEHNDIYRGDARLYMKYKKLSLVANGTRYNVQDGTFYEKELVISNFLSGKEDRLSYTLQYALTENITAYQSTVLSKMEVADDEIVEGEIYKLGAELDFFKTMGITSAVEGYYYNSEISDANGGSIAIEWNLTRKLNLKLEGELLNLETPQPYESTETDETIYSLYLAVEYDVLKDLTVSIFGEDNNETAYLPENRYGIKAAYRF